MTAATLPYKDHFWHGLRVNPSFDEVLQTVGKKIKYQVPDRSAKWFATSVYRTCSSITTNPDPRPPGQLPWSLLQLKARIQRGSACRRLLRQRKRRITSLKRFEKKKRNADEMQVSSADVSWHSRQLQPLLQLSITLGTTTTN
jgi:hypothetical protein